MPRGSLALPDFPGLFKFRTQKTASGNVASMREPLDGSLWWYWIAANAAKKNGAAFKNYHRLSHLFSSFVECR